MASTVPPILAAHITCFGRFEPSGAVERSAEHELGVADHRVQPDGARLLPVPAALKGGLDAMLRRIGVMISVGLADSLNPTTVGPALYLATTGRRVWRVTQFTIGVFAVNFLGGLVLTIGPGRLLIGLVPHPQRAGRHGIELGAGGVLPGAAAALWRGRRGLARRKLPMRSGEGGGSAFLAGASIAAIELPTAVPYLAVIT